MSATRTRRHALPASSRQKGTCVLSTVLPLRSVEGRGSALLDLKVLKILAAEFPAASGPFLIKVPPMGRIATRFASGLLQGVKSRALGALPLMLGLAGCGTVCDEVVDEAEANGCALSPSDSEETAVSQECEGELERRANCLLDLTDNVCAVTEAELADLDACYAAEPLE